MLTERHEIVPTFVPSDLDVLLRRRKKLAEKMNDPGLSENTRAAAQWFYDANERDIALLARWSPRFR